MNLLHEGRETAPALPGVSMPQLRQVSRRGRRLGLVVCLLALIASLTGAALTVVHVRDEHDADLQRTAALSAARRAAVAFTTYDYRHLDTDLRSVQDMATGTFRKQFTAALEALTAGIRTAHGVSAGRVLEAGVVTTTRSSATVIAAVDAVITNSSSTKPGTRHYRLRITLDRTSGSWLVSDIAPVA